METKKILGIIFSILFLGAFAFVLTWGITNFNKVQDAMSGTRIYDANDLDNAYKDGYNTALTNKAEYDELINSYRDDITYLSDTISQLNSEKAGLEKNIQDNLNEINQLEELKATKDETIISLQTTISTNEQTINSLNEQILTLNSEIIILNAEIANLENNIDELETNIDNLETEIANKQATINLLNGQIVDLQSLISQLQTTNTMNLSTIADLNIQISSLDKQIEQLEERLQSNNSTIYELNNKIVSLENSIKYYENYILELENTNHNVAIFEYNGSVYRVVPVDDNNKVTIENPTSTDYCIFNYWMVNDEQVDITTYEVLENTRFVANVTYKYQVSFVVNNETIKSEIVSSGSFASKPENPLSEKYNFVGWVVNGTIVEDVDNYAINKDTVFVAKFVDKYGLFKTNTGEIIYSWQELLDNDFLRVDENGEVTAGIYSKRLSGNLNIDSDVKSIGVSAFKDCSAIVDVVIPEGVTSIGANAFFGCLSIKKIKIPKTVTTIGASAFRISTFYAEADGLEVVDFTGTIEDWCNIVFNSNEYSNPVLASKSLYLNGTKLEGVVDIPTSITEIKSYTFAGFTNDLSLPNSITNVQDYGFSFMNIESLILPNSIESFGKYTFSDSRRLKSVKMPSGIKNLSYAMFYNCMSLESFDFSGIETIGGYCFYDCKKITEMNLPATITSIDKFAFKYCYGVKVLNYDVPTLAETTYTCPYFYDYGDEESGLTVNFGTNVQHLPAYLIYYNDAVRAINMSEQISTATVKTFYALSNLTEINFNCKNLELLGITSYGYGLLTSSTMSTEGTKWSLNIGSTVERLNDYIFYGAYTLEKVRFIGTPKLNYIGSCAFRQCNSLKTFFIPKTVTALSEIDNGKYSAWNNTESELELYCEFDSAPSSFVSKWNWYDNSNQLTTYYGYTYEQYLEAVNE